MKYKAKREHTKKKQVFNCWLSNIPKGDELIKKYLPPLHSEDKINLFIASCILS